VLEQVGTAKWGHGTVPIVKARCYCGNIFVTKYYYLKYGTKKSCGCLRKATCAATGKRNKTHGQSNKTITPTYRTWSAMRSRCLSADDKDYHKYGARGITICDEWNSFENFYNDMGDRPKGLTIDRVDNNGNYEPGNCRWATAKEQGLNRRPTRMLEKDGMVLCMNDWHKKLKLHWRVLERMITSGEFKELQK